MKKIISCFLILCAFVFAGCSGASNLSTQTSIKDVGEFYFDEYINFATQLDELNFLSFVYKNHAQSEHFSKMEKLYEDTTEFEEEEMAAIAAVAVYESEHADKELFFQTKIEGGEKLVRARFENGKYDVDVSYAFGDENKKLINNYAFTVYKNTKEKVWTASYAKDENNCSISLSFSADNSSMQIVTNSFFDNGMMWTTKKTFFALQSDRFAYSISAKYGTGSSESFYEIECLSLSVSKLTFKIAKTKTFEDVATFNELETFTQTTKNDVCGIKVDQTKQENQLDIFGNLKEWQ